jgi:TonB family protein
MTLVAALALTLATTLPPRYDHGALVDPPIAPVLIKYVEPKYPKPALKARLSGVVILEIVIETNGRVSKGRVLKPLPLGLTQAAIDAVQQWRYKPARDRFSRPVRALWRTTVHMRPPAP